MSYATNRLALVGWAYFLFKEKPDGIHQIKCGQQKHETLPVFYEHNNQSLDGMFRIQITQRGEVKQIEQQY